MTGGGAPILPQMGTERANGESGDVAAAAAERLETDVETASEGLSVTVPVDTNVLDHQLHRRGCRRRPARARRRSPRSTSTTATPTARRGSAEVITEAELPEASPPNYPLVRWSGAGRGPGPGGGRGLRVGPARGTGYAARPTSGRPQRAARPRLGAAGAGPGRTRSRLRVRIRQAFGYLAAQLTSLTENKRRDVAVLVTSPRSGAGTTTVAAQTAIALAELGRDVVLVVRGRAAAVAAPALRRRHVPGPHRGSRRRVHPRPGPAHHRAPGLRLLAGRSVTGGDGAVQPRGPRAAHRPAVG